MVCTGQCKSTTGRQTSTPPHGSDNEDIWGSEDEAVSPYADLKRAHVNQGYLDGITQAQESGLQEGFDQGYPEGAELGMLVGEILARSHGTSLFQQAKMELNITKVLDKKYFDEQLDLAHEKHPLVEQWKEKVERI